MVDLECGLEVQKKTKFEFQAEKKDEKKRLDIFLSEKGDFSRNFASKLVSEKKVLVNDKNVKSSYKIKNQDLIRGWIPEIQPLSIEPENIPLKILYEDEYLAIINKPAKMVVHPAPGHESGTLVNAVLYHFQNISDFGDNQRPGIVHRLDKDTSGAIIIAKTLECHEKLSALFKNREVEKKYLAIVFGAPMEKGRVEKPIGRHPRDRKKMAVVYSGGRYALSYYHVLKFFDDLSLVKVNIKTGRTHQIRVHMASEGHPLLGDEVYGYKAPLKHIGDDGLKSFIKNNLNRQMLHSYEISFLHPYSGEKIFIQAPLLDDMELILSRLNV